MKKDEDDRSRIEEIIRKRTREITSDEYGQKTGEIFTRDCTMRKIHAASALAPVLEERFGEKYPSKNWAEISAALAVLNSISPDRLDIEIHFLYGVAYFILDAVYYSDKDQTNFGILEKILRNDYVEDNVDEDVYDNFVDKHLMTCYHPLYLPGTVDSIIDILAFRNLDYTSYRKEKRGSGNYSVICDSVTTAYEKPPGRNTGFSAREALDSMLSLVPESDKNEAEESFRDLFFRLIDAYLEGRELLGKQKRKLDAQDEYIDYLMKELDSKDKPEKEESKALIEKFDEMDRKRADYNFSYNNYDDDYTFGLFSDPDIRNRYSKAFESIDVADPYKVVAGYFFLLLKNDDLVWLMSAAMAALAYAGRLLPWAEVEWKPEWEPEFPEAYHVPDNFYRPVLKPEDVGYEQYMAPTMSPAKFIFFMSNTVPPRYTYSFPERERVRTLAGDELTIETEKSYLSSYHAARRTIDSEDYLLKSYVDNLSELRSVKDELSSMSEKLSEAENEKEKGRRIKEGVIDELRRKLDSASRAMERMAALQSGVEDELEKARKEIARLKTEHRDEKEELNTLRELIFENRNDNSQMEDEDSCSFTWPYETKLNTVVIGGHPDWINKVRSLLPSVRFFGDRAPDRESLKHTDVLWFQTKICLSHPTFYKVIETAKSLGIPIRYCRSFGIYSSAEAIAQNDREHRL